jgi:hypothetical protein
VLDPVRIGGESAKPSVDIRDFFFVYVFAVKSIRGRGFRKETAVIVLKIAGTAFLGLKRG